MQKLKALLVAMAVASLLGQSVMAQQLAMPRAQDGRTLGADEAACVPYHIDASTGTAEVMIRGTAGLTGNTVTTVSPGYVSWVLLSTGAATVTLSVRDTDKLGAGDEHAILPPLTFPGPGLMLGNNDTAKLNTPIRFDPPLQFSNGLTAKISATGVAATLCTGSYKTPGK